MYTGMSSGYQLRSLVEATTRKPQSPRSLASYSRWCNAICLRDAEIFVGVARRGTVLRYAIAYALMRARKVVRGLREGFAEAERYAVAYHVVSQLKERAFLGTWIEIGQVSAREIVGRPRELEMRPPWNGCCAEASPGLVAMFQLAPMEVLSHNKKNPSLLSTLPP